MRDEGVERKLQLGWLLDFYGSFLTGRQRTFLDLHYNHDLSLAEIAEQAGISRQGVHDAIRRGEAALLDMEERLGLVMRFIGMSTALETLQNEIDAWCPCDESDQNRKSDWSARVREMRETLT